MPTLDCYTQLRTSECMGEHVNTCFSVLLFLPKPNSLLSVSTLAFTVTCVFSGM